MSKEIEEIQSVILEALGSNPEHKQVALKAAYRVSEYFEPKIEKLRKESKELRKLNCDHYWTRNVMYNRLVCKKCGKVSK